MDRGTRAGVEAALVPIENFDETLRDLIRLLEGIDTRALADFTSGRRPWTPASFPHVRRRGWPVVRLNALPVVDAPSTCRRVDCIIGGTSEVREAVEKAGVDVLAVRSHAGVLAFGADTDVRAAFQKYDITKFDLHTLELHRRRYESTERGLLRAALTSAILRHRSLDGHRRRNSDLLSPANPQDAIWQPLRKLVGALNGTVREHPDLQWSEGISVRLVLRHVKIFG